VLLTENTKNDQLGLRRLLRDHVGPSIDARSEDGLSLTTFFKTGKTAYPAYCELLLQHFGQRSWLPGYHEFFL
jgi:hypothetical protein